MVAFPRKWLGPLIAVAFLWPLLRPVWPDVFSDYRLFLVSTMIIAAIAVLGLNLLGDGLRDILDPQSTTRRA